MSTTHQEQLQKYADLVLKVGINLQPNQGLVLNFTKDSLDLARLIVAKAYAMGAKHVVTMFGDDEFTLARYKNADAKVFENFPPYLVEMYKNLYLDDYHHLFLASPNPKLLSSVDPKIVATDSKTSGVAMADVQKYRMTGHTKWCIAAVPCEAWAISVFPDLDPQDAIDRLWEKVLDAMRVSRPDPIAAWEEHQKNLSKYRGYLNEQKFKSLHFQSPRTDLVVELAEDHHWMGGGKDSLAGEMFVANIPTEEVFTTPHRLRVNGHVEATKPLSLRGQLIEGFGFTFKDGAVTDFHAEQGYEVLKQLIETDEGARRLGEVALVQHDSPISNTGILFNNTLFDENASIHLAFGKAYSYAMENGAQCSEEELKARGANDSVVHVDFMIGSSDMTVTAERHNGETVTLFQDGNWVF
ncbi:MAG: aminopeptidase [Bacillota bacterium]|nr:aminopeptidase [Bacillota bacterium]